MREVPVLQVGESKFEGWTEVAFERALDSLAGGFSFRMTERWPEHPEQWRIAAGLACSVLLGGERLCKGWIDEANYAIDPGDHPIDIAGRDVTADLIDCSAIHATGSWANRKLEQIAGDLIAPFGIVLGASDDTGATFGKFALQQGETVFEALDRMCRMRGVLPTTSAAGALRFMRPGRAKAAYRLELGVNVKSVRVRNSARDRFSKYLLKGQASGREVTGSASRPSAEAIDVGVGRYRPLLIVNSEQSTGASLSERAKWEATVRAGRGQEVVVTVEGWRPSTGGLFILGELAPVIAPLVGVEDELLVKGLRQSLTTSDGSVTEITLCPPEAFSLLTLPEPKAKTDSRVSTPLAKRKAS